MTQGLKHPGTVTIGLEVRCLVTLRQVTIVGPATFGLMTSGLVTLSQETLGRLTIGLKPLDLVTLSLETIGASYACSRDLRYWDSQTSDPWPCDLRTKPLDLVTFGLNLFPL